MKKNILISLLAITVVLLSGFIVYDKIIKKETPKTETKNEKTVEVTEPKEENLDEIAGILVGKLEKYRVDYYDSLENITFNEVSENEKLTAAFLYGNNKNQTIDLKKADVDDYFQNLFGKTLTTYPDLQCWNGDGILYKFNIETNEYQKDCGDKETCHAHGGLDNHPNSIFIKYNNIKKENNNYVITVNKVFGSNLRDSDGYFYADYKYSVKIDGLDIYANQSRELETTEKINVKNYYESNYEKFKDITPQYRYTFEKVNDDYYLTKLEIVK